MKLKTIVMTSLIALSANTASASSAIDHLSTQSIKLTLTPTQIDTALNQWKEQELTRMEERAQLISDRAPIEARREMVKYQIEQEYNRTVKAFGL
ncbi:hypothetical protein BI375_07950 [Vibrio rotiferianus]|uniref:Conjugal transfer protein n=1 Tax=Vibrio rotiferianus TaxID=190895 RepID=A0ABX3D5C3_9VIBR|nr:hypothetical protein [Vibrio rotiferianus]OHY90171.1 hypothetical protein BI375_07950 [Vibrio rotiferianus]